MTYTLQSKIIKERLTPGQHDIDQLTREEIKNILTLIEDWVDQDSRLWIGLVIDNYLDTGSSWTIDTISMRLKEVGDDIINLRAALKLSQETKEVKKDD